MTPDSLVSSLLSLANSIDSSVCKSRKVVAANLDHILYRLGAGSYEIAVPQDNKFAFTSADTLLVSKLMDYSKAGKANITKMLEALKDKLVALNDWKVANVNLSIDNPSLYKANYEVFLSQIKDECIELQVGDVNTDAYDFPGLIKDKIADLTKKAREFDIGIEVKIEKWNDPNFLNSNLHNPILIEAVKASKSRRWKIKSINDNKYAVVETGRAPYETLERPGGLKCITPSEERSKIASIINASSEAPDLARAFDLDQKLNQLVSRREEINQLIKEGEVSRSIKSIRASIASIAYRLAADTPVMINKVEITDIESPATRGSEAYGKGVGHHILEDLPPVPVKAATVYLKFDISVNNERRVEDKISIDYNNLDQINKTGIDDNDLIYDMVNAQNGLKSRGIATPKQFEDALKVYFAANPSVLARIKKFILQYAKKSADPAAFEGSVEDALKMRRDSLDEEIQNLQDRIKKLKSPSISPMTGPGEEDLAESYRREREIKAMGLIDLPQNKKYKDYLDNLDTIIPWVTIS